MKVKLTILLTGLVVLIVTLYSLVSKTQATTGQETCPQTDGWVKVDSDDLSGYPVAGATSYCFKAGSDNSQGCEGGLFDAIPQGGFEKPYCGLSHWSYLPGPTPNPDKSVTVVEDCFGEVVVTIYGGNTRRTWRVNGIEKWVEKYDTVVWETTSPVDVEWWHEGSQSWKPADDQYTSVVEARDCPVNPTPDPTPEITLKQSFSAPSKPSATQCPNEDTVKVGANFHVFRKGDQAILQWFATQGAQVNIYYFNPNDLNDTHALRDSANDGYELIEGLGNKDWTFGLQQKDGCGGGPIVWVVDGPTTGWVLFR